MISYVQYINHKSCRQYLHINYEWDFQKHLYWTNSPTIELTRSFTIDFKESRNSLRPCLHYSVLRSNSENRKIVIINKYNNANYCLFIFHTRMGLPSSHVLPKNLLFWRLLPEFLSVFWKLNFREGLRKSYHPRMHQILPPTCRCYSCKYILPK